MYCNRLHAWRSTQSWLETSLSSLIACRRVRIQILWRFWLKDLSIDKRIRAWCCAWSHSHWGLTVGFILLLYSVVFTVQLLSLFYFLFINLCLYKIWEVMSWLHLLWSSYDLFVYNFPFNFFGIKGGFKLRRMCLHCLWSPCDFFR